MACARHGFAQQDKTCYKSFELPEEMSNQMKLTHCAMASLLDIEGQQP